MAKTDMEKLKETANRNTFNGTRIARTTKDTNYNQGQYDFAKDWYTKEREYFLRCNGF